MHESQFRQPSSPRRVRLDRWSAWVLAMLAAWTLGVAPAMAAPLRLAQAEPQAEPQAEIPGEAAASAEDGETIPADELYRKGLAAEQAEQPDYAAAIDFYTRAGLGGHAAAMRRLARLYDEGLGVAADPEEAKRLYYEAARHSDAEAQYIFAARYAESDDERVTWLWHATIRGQAAARRDLMATEAFADATPPPFDETAAQLDPSDGIECVQSALNALGHDAGAVDGLIGPGTRGALAAYIGDREGQIAETPLNPVTAIGWCLFIHRVGADALEATDTVERLRENAATEVSFDVSPEVGFYLATFEQGTLQDAFRPERTIETPGGQRPAARLMFRDIATSTQICLLFDEGWGVRLEDGSSLGTFCIGLVPEMMAARGFFFPVPVVALNEE